MICMNLIKQFMQIVRNIVYTFPQKLEFPNLQLLILTNRGSSSIGEGNKIRTPTAFFERMKALRVLSVETMSISFEPSSWASINNLEALYGCQIVELLILIALVKVLKQLKILKMWKNVRLESGVYVCEN